MGTYILLLLLLAIAGVTVYTYSKKPKSTTPSAKPQLPESKPTSPAVETPKATPTTNDTGIKIDENPIPTPSDSKPKNTEEIDKKPKSKKPKTSEDEAIAAYADRKGYDADFVSKEDFRIELKDLLKNVKNQLTEIKDSTLKNKNFLNYHHFTVAMNKERNMPMLTAVNIDGSKTVENNRESDKWVLDPRLDKTQQLGLDYYKGNNLDLGHLVRRLDPVWGDVALIANEDTFHLTVCAPQHKKLNRVTWLSLEDYILKNTDNEDLKVSVFTGPVFTNNDFPYRNALLPLEFWKMAAIIKNDGTPSVTAYLLSHKDFLSDMGEKGLIGEKGFGEFKTYQISLDRLEALTNLNLENLKQYDPLAGTNALMGEKDYFEIEEESSLKL